MTQVHVAEFGAFGESQNEGPAFQAAAMAAIEANAELICDPEKTYVFAPETQGGNGWRIPLQNGQSFRFDGRGATLKFKDGLSATPGRFWHLMYVAMTSAAGVSNAIADLVQIRNLRLDGNHRGQPVPAGPSDYEQRAALKVQATGSNRMSRVLIENVTSVDPMADAVMVGPSQTTAFDLDGDGVAETASIAHVTLRNIHEEGRTSSRALIASGSGAGHVFAENITSGRTAAGARPSKVEYEISQIGTQECSLTLSNSALAALELSGKTDWTTGESLKVRLSNVTLFDYFLAGYLTLDATNCRLPLLLSNSMPFRRARFTACDFSHRVRADGQTAKLYLAGLNVAGRKLEADFNACRFLLANGVPAPTSLVEVGNMLETSLGLHTYRFTGCEFDTTAPTSIDCHGGGRVITRDCRMNTVRDGSFVSGGKTYKGEHIAL